MSSCVMNRILGVLALVVGLCASTVVNAWPDGGNVHHHGGGPRAGVEVYNNGGYYNRGGFFYGGGWYGPNVVINVPTRRYYVPACENVEVCDRYGQCWLERYCD